MRHFYHDRESVFQDNPAPGSSTQGLTEWLTCVEMMEIVCYGLYSHQKKWEQMFWENVDSNITPGVSELF